MVISADVGQQREKRIDGSRGRSRLAKRQHGDKSERSKEVEIGWRD